MSKSENKKTSKDEDKKKSEAKAIGDAIIAAANARREELAKEALATRSNKTLPKVVKEKPKEEKPKESKPKEEKPKESKPKEEKPKAAPPSKTDTEEVSLPEFEKSFVDKISSQFTGDVEVGYIKENRTRVNVKKRKFLKLHNLSKITYLSIMQNLLLGLIFLKIKTLGLYTTWVPTQILLIQNKS